MDEAAAAEVQRTLEGMEKRLGRTANSFGPLHLTQRWAHALVTSPAILDRVEDLLGPNILVWSSQFWVKEPGSGSFVGWHQARCCLLCTLLLPPRRCLLPPALHPYLCWLPCSLPTCTWIHTAPRISCVVVIGGGCALLLRTRTTGGSSLTTW
jgi:hypothetical protein